MAFQPPDYLGTHKELWGDGAGAAKALTVGFVSTDTFTLKDHDVVALEIVLSGTAVTSLDLRLEISMDSGSEYKIIPLPSGGVLPATTNQFITWKVLPYARYRLSAKRTGGAADSSVLIKGSSRQGDALENLAISALGAIAVAGDVAHDAVDAGNPVKVGGHARSSQRTAVANDDRADFTTNVYGEQVIAGYDWTSLANRADLTHIAGTATNVNGGNRDAGTQTTTLADDDPAVVALQIIDDWDESNRAAVNLIVGQAGISAGSAAVGATTPSVTLATNDPAVVSLAIMDDWDNAASDGASVSGDVAHDSVDTGEPVKIGARARSSQITAVASNDRTDLIANVYGEQVVAGYDWNTSTLKTTEQSPITAAYTYATATLSAVISGTTDYVYYTMDGYRDLTIHYYTAGGTAATCTITFEGSVENVGTLTVLNWVDITEFGMDPVNFNIPLSSYLSPASTAQSWIWKLKDGSAFKHVRVKYVTGGGAALTAYFYSKQQY